MSKKSGWFPTTPGPGVEGPKSATGLARLIAGGAFNYGLGQTLPLILGFLLVPVYTAVLTPKDYGILEMMAVFGGVLGAVARFGVPGAVSRYYYEHPEGPELRDYVTSVAWFLRISALIVGGLSLVLGHLFMHRIAPDLEFYPFVPLVVLATMLATNSELQRRLVQVRRQSAYSARLSILTSLVAISLTILFVVGLRLGAAGMLLAQAITSALFLVNATLYLQPDLGGQVRPEAIRESIRYGRGPFASHLVAAASPFISRALLAGSASLGTVGLYALASRVTSPLTIIGQAFATAYTPEYFAARRDGGIPALQALAKVEAGIWTLAVLGTLAAALLGPAMLVLITPERFHPAASLVPILAVGFLGQVLYALTSPEMFYSKQRWLPVVVQGASFVTIVVLTIALVGRFGASGVAWASVAGTSMTGVVCGVFAARSSPVPHAWSALMRAPLLALATMAVLSFRGDESPTKALATGIAALVACSSLLLVAGDPAMKRIVREVRKRAIDTARRR